MLLNEIATVIDINSKLKKRKEERDEVEKERRSEERISQSKERRKTIKDKDPDKIGSKRREKLSDADKARDIARQLRHSKK